MCQDSDPAAQKIHRGKAERILLASFVAGLSGEIGKQVGFYNSPNLYKVLTTALAVSEI